MINEIRLRIAEFLGTPLIGSKYFFLDYWTFAHFFSGFFGMFLIFKFLKKMDNVKKFGLLFFFLCLWEVFEYYSPWVVNEPAIDVIYDLIIGMFAGYVYYWKFTK